MHEKTFSFLLLLMSIRLKVIYVGIIIEKFVKLMNSIFSNPYLLHEFDEGNISCAYDMAILLSELLKNPTFLKIENLKKYNSTNHGVWFNKNKLMKQYKWAISCKTGVAPIFARYIMRLNTTK